MPVTKHSAVQAAFAFSFDSLAREVAPAPAPEPMPPFEPPVVAAVVALPTATPAPAGKACKTCGVWKPVEQFHKLPNGPLSRDPHCKPCKNATRRKPAPPADPMPTDADGNPAEWWDREWFLMGFG